MNDDDFDDFDNWIRDAYRGLDAYLAERYDFNFDIAKGLADLRARIDRIDQEQDGHRDDPVEHDTSIPSAKTHETKEDSAPGTHVLDHDPGDDADRSR